MRLVWLAVGSGVLVALYAFDPATTRLFPSCPFHLLTGWHCPGCGTLRAVHALLHGRFSQALHDNPFVLAVGFMAAAASAADGARSSAGVRQLARMTSPAGIVCLLVAASVFTVARNIPIRPFVWMVP